MGESFGEGSWVSLCTYTSYHREILQFLLRAPSSVGRRNAMRVDEGRKGWSLLAVKEKVKMKACTVVGKGEKSLLSD